MQLEFTCDKCGKKSVFDDASLKGKKPECPHCGSSIRSAGTAAEDELSSTMRIDAFPDEG